MGYDIKQVIVVRKDLNMRKGKMCAQVAHASMKVLLDRMEIKSCRKKNVLQDKFVEITTERCLKLPIENYINQWLDGAFAKVVVSCDSEEELKSLANKSFNAGLPYAIITDAGATEFDGEPTITCLAIGPHSSEEIDKITGNLKLL